MERLLPKKHAVTFFVSEFELLRFFQTMSQQRDSGKVWELLIDKDITVREANLDK